MNQNIGTNIQIRRSAAHLTQEELAERIGCSREFISQIERGWKLPSLPIAVRIAQVFGCSVEELCI